MKYFCSYANTGEDITKVTARMQKIVEVLTSNGHNVYCDLFDKALLKAQAAKNKDFKKILKTDFEEIKKYDIILAIITSPRRSIGQLMELGAAYSQNTPIILLEHKSASGSYSYLPDLVSEHYTWENDKELIKIIKEITTHKK